MEKKSIMIKTAEELENMTVDNTVIDAALRERWICIKGIMALLKAEVDKIQEIVLDKYEHKPVKTGEVFKAVVFDKFIIDEQLLVELCGPEILEKVKVRPVHTEYIKAS